jgi:hypothetical protein
VLPRSRATRATVSATWSPGSTSRFAPKHRGELAQRGQLALLIAVGVAARRADPQHVELRAQPLGRAPRAADEPLCARIGLHQREQPLADRLGGVGGEVVVARADDLGDQALGLDLLGHLAQRDLAQRRQVLDAEEAVEGRVDALGLVDLACAQAGQERLGGSCP